MNNTSTSSISTCTMKNSSSSSYTWLIKRTRLCLSQSSIVCQHIVKTCGTQSVKQQFENSVSPSQNSDIPWCAISVPISPFRHNYYGNSMVHQQAHPRKVHPASSTWSLEPIQMTMLVDKGRRKWRRKLTRNAWSLLDGVKFNATVSLSITRKGTKIGRYLT